MNRNFIATCALLFAGFVASARAQQVDAALTQDAATLGQPVRMNIVVTGARGAQVPQEIKVNGLVINFMGKSEQMQMQWGSGGMQTSSTQTFTYLIVPSQQGEFTIPAQSVSVGGKTFKTAPLKLQVFAGQGGVPVRPAIPVQPGQQSVPPAVRQPQNIPPTARQAPPQQLPGRPPTPPSEDSLAFGDLIIPKKTAFVGEIVPVEIRFYFDAHTPVRLQDRPSFSGDGFTVYNFSKPGERQQEVNGRLYNVVIFQTALTPVKSGPLEIPSATLEAAIQMPSRGRNDDFFSGFFGMSESQQKTITTEPVTLDVKALPKDGRPEEFSGAIGQFSIKSSASPKKAGAGDPISLNVTVAGRGNFNGMGAPILIEDEAWRSYPPGEKFEPSPTDPIGYNGEKHFEYMIVARTDATKTPVAEFSYFDPAIEKYVTLKTSPVNVEAKGGGAPAPAVPAATVAAASPTATPVVAETPAAPENGLATRFVPATFEPFIFSKAFLIANGVAATAWGLALFVALGRMATSSSYVKQSAARKESRKILHKMEDPACEAEVFYQSAEDFVRSHLAGETPFADVRALLEEAKLKPETKDAVRGVLDHADELKYSTGGTARLGAEERSLVLGQLKAFDNELH